MLAMLLLLLCCRCGGFSNESPRYFLLPMKTLLQTWSGVIETWTAFLSPSPATVFNACSASATEKVCVHSLCNGYLFDSIRRSATSTERGSLPQTPFTVSSLKNIL